MFMSTVRQPASNGATSRTSHRKDLQLKKVRSLINMNEVVDKAA